MPLFTPRTFASFIKSSDEGVLQNCFEFCFSIFFEEKKYVHNQFKTLKKEKKEKPKAPNCWYTQKPHRHFVFFSVQRLWVYDCVEQLLHRCKWMPMIIFFWKKTIKTTCDFIRVYKFVLCFFKIKFSLISRFPWWHNWLWAVLQQ